MELRLIGDLLKSGHSPLPSFLAPSTHSSLLQSTAPRQRQILLHRFRKQPHRPFLSTSRRRGPSSSSAAVDYDFFKDIPQPSKSKPPPRPPPPSPRKNATSSTIDDLLVATFRPRKKKADASSTESSASAVEAGYKASEYYELRDKGARFPGSLAQSMNFPNQPRTSDASSAAIGHYGSQGRVTVGEARRAKRTIRTCPSVGRTVEIDKEREVDFGKALVKLEVQCAANKIRVTAWKQRFHERPGMKRKRLKSERWRALFRESFRATVGRVKEMRRKGW